MTGWWLRLMGLESGARVDQMVSSRWIGNPLASPTLFYAVLGLTLLLAAISLLPWINMRRRVRVYTFLARLGMGALLLAAMAGTTWRVRLRLHEKPQWVVLLDDSGSMAVRDVAGRSRHAAALADLERLRSQVGSRVDLQVETFSGQPLADEPGLGPTLFQDAVARVALARLHPDLLLILTDGRDSQDRDLHDLGVDLRLRDIACAIRLLGQKQPPAYAGLTASPARNIIRLGEELSIAGEVTGSGSDTDVQVQLYEDGKPIRRLTAFAAEAGRFAFRHRPEQPGRRVYRLERELAETATTTGNDVRFTVDVVDDKINVLLLEGMPRFEFKIVKSVLEVDPLVRLVSVCHLPGGGVYVQGEPLHDTPEQGLIASPAELFKYDLVVLQDVPRGFFRSGGDSTESRLQNIVQFVLKRGGGLIVKGGLDVFRAGAYESSPLAPILPFDLSDAFGAQAQFDGLFFVNVVADAYRHPLLQLLPDPAENRARLEALRELDGANNVGRFKPMAVPLMTRLLERPGGPLEVPILAEMAVGDGRVLAVAADTLWRWQLQAEFDDPPLTMLLANAVRYLAPPPGRRPGAPNISLPDGIPQVGQELLLTTELRDRNYDPIREADLEVTITAPDGVDSRLFPRDLPEEPGLYHYRVKIEQPGLYRATSRFGRHSSTREFYAGGAAGEFFQLAADRPAMQRLATAANGELIDDFEAWLSQADLRTAQRLVDRDLEVWNSPLAMLLFLALVSFDCHVRKRHGLV